ncbi:hypothetical protein RHMOL_Rhmol01G0258100 [Rhododendron molle]|uniref:Uncharacterized protein n=1 Tax=Rhododendron molle TaxID=49168 RepID=A0ACC0Q7C5_RHOML|nr:hypothetical protein RHMOL_Rhmol01G0258100 [Rhododendron molle]
MPYLVRENLFISNIGDAAEVLQNGSDNSKSALSPEKLLCSLEYAGKDLKFVRMAVAIKDTESENLLDYLDVCLDFIDQSRKEGGVLVHCFAGMSRSAPFNLDGQHFGGGAKEERGSMHLKLYGKAVNLFAPITCSVQSCPLKMFEEMGFKVDHSSPIYKRFHLKLLGDFYSSGNKIDNSKFGADPGLPTEEVSSEIGTAVDAVKVASPAYRCKKCRRVVAVQDNVVDHVPGEGETSFQWHKRRSGNPFNKCDEMECSSIFVEPLCWMTAVEEGASEGKLMCAHCEGRLGYFNWSGIQCSCGSWITPAFQLHKSRVDISTI